MLLFGPTYKCMHFLKMLSLRLRNCRWKSALILFYIIFYLVSYSVRDKVDSTSLTNQQHSGLTSLIEKEKKQALRIRRCVDNSVNSKHDSRRSNSTEVWASNKDRIRIYSNRTVTYPWIGDDECQHYFVQFAPKHTFKPRALVSFPGSGNSWLRYLIESASGYFTGSVFRDHNIFKLGFLGEYKSPNDGTTLVQKTHHDTNARRKLKAYVKLSELMFGYRGILVIRNPYDALLSYWNFFKTRNQTGFVPKPGFRNKEWDSFARRGIRKWTSLIKTWMTNSKDFLIVQYEELKQNPKQELLKILEYLSQPVDPDRLKCLDKHLEGPFHRRELPKDNSNKNNLSNMDKESIEIPTSSAAGSNNPPTPMDQNHKLDLIIQQNIHEINLFLQEISFPLFLNYTNHHGSMF